MITIPRRVYMNNQIIEVAMSGGIGNQLFQYSAGLSVSARLKAELVLDISWYQRSKEFSNFRTMELHQFVDLEGAGISTSRLNSKLRLAQRKIQNFAIVRDITCDPVRLGSLEAYQNIRMEGYWQSERYFTNIQHSLRKAIAKRDFVSDLSFGLADEIESTKCIGLHVRRGDYITNSNALAYHGVCDAEYFNRGVKYVRGSQPIELIYLFSDDIDWCQKNLDFGIETRIVEDNICDTDQLKLLSLCNHQVISNSSFSWWAAWLGKTTDQVVVYPRFWFANQTNLESMPAGWISM